MTQFAVLQVDVPEVFELARARRSRPTHMAIRFVTRDMWTRDMD